MMFHRLGLINKNQRGIGIIELLIAVGLAAAIISAISMSMLQLYEASARSSSHMSAVRQVQNVGYWVSHDAQMSQTQISDDPATAGVTEFLVLSWVDSDGKSHRVVYTLLDMSGGLKQMQRSYTIDGTTETGVIAEYIDPDPAKTNLKLTGGGTFSLPDDDDSFTITDSTGGDSGSITITGGTISVTKTGGATYQSSTGTWTTPNAGDTIVVTASSPNTSGSWTATTWTASAAITTDDNGDATITGSVLVLKVTASVTSGTQTRSETRIYEVIPRPGS